MNCEECEGPIVGEGVIFYEDVPGDVAQHHFCSVVCQDAYYESGGYAAKAANRAVAAERTRIVARLRAKADADDPPRTTVHYNATVRRRAKFFREAATLIEQGEGERG